MYLAFSNQGSIRDMSTGKSSRYFLSVFGHSTKSEKFIGQFGTGAKLAATALVRAGLEVVVSSYDECPYQLRYEAKVNDAIGCETIAYRFTGGGKEEVLDSQMATTVGKNWLKPVGSDSNEYGSYWMAIREFIQNGIDSDTASQVKSFSTRLEESVKFWANYTFVYVGMDEKLEALSKNINQYWKGGEKPLFECGAGRVFKKSSSQTRIFANGLLVEVTDSPSAYDYDLTTKNLTEERTFRCSYDMHYYIYCIFCALANQTIVDEVVRSMSDSKSLESTAIETMGGIDFSKREKADVTVTCYRRAFKHVHGEKAALASENPFANSDAAGSFGYKLAKCGDGVRKLFATSGVKDAIAVTNRAGGTFEIVQPDKETQAKLEDAVSSLNAVLLLLKKERLPIESCRVFRAATEDHGKINGCVVPQPDGTKLVMFREDYISSASLTDLIGTATEEWIHFSSGASDMTRQFQHESTRLFGATAAYITA